MRIESDEMLRARERGDVPIIELPRWMRGEEDD